MTTLIVEVTKKQKQVLTGILKHLNVAYKEVKTKQLLDPYKQRTIIDYGIGFVAESEVEVPFSQVDDAAEYVRKIRNDAWK